MSSLPKVINITRTRVVSCARHPFETSSTLHNQGSSVLGIIKLERGGDDGFSRLLIGMGGSEMGDPIAESLHGLAYFVVCPLAMFPAGVLPFLYWGGDLIKLDELGASFFF